VFSLTEALSFSIEKGGTSAAASTVSAGPAPPSWSRTTSTLPASPILALTILAGRARTVPRKLTTYSARNWSASLRVPLKSKASPSLPSASTTTWQ